MRGVELKSLGSPFQVIHSSKDVAVLGPPETNGGLPGNRSGAESRETAFVCVCVLPKIQRVEVPSFFSAGGIPPVQLDAQRRGLHLGLISISDAGLMYLH